MRDDAPWKTLKDLERHVKNSDRALKASGTAQGGIWHLALAGWYSAIGKDPGELNWLSSKGSAASMAELLAGTIDAVCCSLPEAVVQLEGMQVRCLGVMANQRVKPKFPEVPTFQEQGYEWSMGGWRGIGIPRDTPPEVRQRIVTALDRVVNGEEFRGFMARQGFNWMYQPPEEFRVSLQDADESLGALIRSDAFKPSGNPSSVRWFIPPSSESPSRASSSG